MALELTLERGNEAAVKSGYKIGDAEKETHQSLMHLHMYEYFKIKRQKASSRENITWSEYTS